MASASLVQVIDLTGPPSPTNNGTRKTRKSPNHNVEVRTSRKRKNGETSRTRESRGCSAEVDDEKLDEVVEIRPPEGAKGGNDESSTKKRSRRSMKSKDKGKDPVTSSLEDTQQDPPPAPTLEDSQFFYVDTAPAPVPASMAFDSGAADAPQLSSSSRVPEADKTPPLLLPAHVSVLDAVGELPIQIVQPVDPDSDAESFIEYLDYDDRLTAGTVRYFETPAEDQKQARFICKRCGAESEHRTRECPIMICLTCGARDEHSTRSCPIGKTCFTCGMKGHINKTCPNRHTRDKVNQFDDCDRCGSSTHNTNECPTIWRLYEYVTDREREAILKRRESKRLLALGEGGEGYIARDEWCYNCGECGHLGDDCNASRPHDAPSAPSAFGQFNVFTGPFSDDADPASPVRTRAPRDWETSESFGDGWGASAPINVGKRARNKDRMRMEQRALEIQELSDADDWFGNPRNVRNRGTGGRGGAAPRERDNNDGGTTKGMKIRFLASTPPPHRGGPSLLERVHGGGGDDDKRTRQHHHHRDQRTSRDRERGRGHGERHHRDWDRERDRDRDRDRDDEGPGPGLRIRGSAGKSSNNPSRYRDDEDGREERRGNNRRWEDSRSGDREQERYRDRDGHRERSRGHERERRSARGPQYRGGYAR